MRARIQPCSQIERTRESASLHLIIVLRLWSWAGRPGRRYAFSAAGLSVGDGLPGSETGAAGAPPFRVGLLIVSTRFVSPSKISMAQTSSPASAGGADA